MPRRRSASSDARPRGLLAQRLELGQRVAEVVAAHGRELGLGGHDLGVELGQPALELALGLLQLGRAARRALLELRVRRLGSSRPAT